MKWLYFCICFLAILSCSDQKIDPPVLQNSSNIFYIDTDTFFLVTPHKEWDLALYSFTHPIPLKKIITDQGIKATPEVNHGIIEGPAQLIATFKNEVYAYNFNLKNKAITTPELIDYRSPKTVNTDSSLQHQSIRMRIDQHRNLLNFEGSEDIFREQIHYLGTKVKSERAIADESITAYYVNPGTPVSIPLKSVYDKNTNSYKVETGILIDKYNNLIADGTAIYFKYSINGRQYTLSSTTLKGRAGIFIKNEGDLSGIKIYASVHHVVSQSINIVP